MMAAYGDAAVVRATFDEVSTALGRDLWQLVGEGPAETLNQTVNTQPLMLTAGVAGATYIFCLPGSPGACRDGWDGILAAQLDYRTRPCNFVAHLKRLPGQDAQSCGPRS